MRIVFQIGRKISVFDLDFGVGHLFKRHTDVFEIHALVVFFESHFGLPRRRINSFDHQIGDFVLEAFFGDLFFLLGPIRTIGWVGERAICDGILHTFERGHVDLAVFSFETLADDFRDFARIGAINERDQLVFRDADAQFFSLLIEDCFFQKEVPNLSADLVWIAF